MAELTEQLEEFKEAMEKKTATLAAKLGPKKSVSRVNSKYTSKGKKLLEAVEDKLKEKVDEALDKSSLENTHTNKTPAELKDVTEELMEDADATIELPMITPSRGSSRQRPDMSLHYDAERRFDENSKLDGM